jgi:hypothetical protein
MVGPGKGMIGIFKYNQFLFPVHSVVDFPRRLRRNELVAASVHEQGGAGHGSGRCRDVVGRGVVHEGPSDFHAVELEGALGLPPGHLGLRKQLHDGPGPGHGGHEDQGPQLPGHAPRSEEGHGRAQARSHEAEAGESLSAGPCERIGEVVQPARQGDVLDPSIRLPASREIETQACHALFLEGFRVGSLLGAVL